MLIVVGAILFVVVFFVLTATLNKSKISFNYFYDFDWHVTGSGWAVFMYLGIIAALGLLFFLLAKYGLKYYPA